MKKVWELLALVVVLIIVVHVAIAAFQPYMAAFGLVVFGLLVGTLVKFLYFRRRP